MRVASLDYLGIVAARLRKDAITSRLNTEGINEILSKVTLNKLQHEIKIRVNDGKNRS